MGDSLRGQLLIASPALSDYFRRTVVLVIEHSEEGAMGVVLNRPSEASVSEAVPDLADAAGADDLVWIGGPVAAEAVVALGEFEDPSDAGTLVLESVGTLDPDRPGAALRSLRVYAGYAGWGPGQLESELEQDAWIVEAADPDDPFREGDLWSFVLGRKGGRYALLATMPADASLN
jgi:putative transcriptional regulator